MKQELDFRIKEEKTLSGYFHFFERFTRELEQDLQDQIQIERLFLPGIFSRPVPNTGAFLLWRKPLHAFDPAKHAQAEEILTGLSYHFMRMAESEIRSHMRQSQRWLPALIHFSFRSLQFSPLYDLASLLTAHQIEADELYSVVSILEGLMEENQIRSRYYRSQVRREIPFLVELQAFLENGKLQEERSTTLSGKWANLVWMGSPEVALRKLYDSTFLTSPIYIYEALAISGQLFRARRFLLRFGNRLHDPAGVQAILLSQDFSEGKFASYLRRSGEIEELPGPWVWMETAVILAKMNRYEKNLTEDMQDFFAGIPRESLPPEQVRRGFVSFLESPEEAPETFDLEDPLSEPFLKIYYFQRQPGPLPNRIHQPLYRSFALRSEGILADRQRFYTDRELEAMSGESLVARVLLALRMCERNEPEMLVILLRGTPALSPELKGCFAMSLDETKDSGRRQKILSSLHEE